MGRIIWTVPRAQPGFAYLISNSSSVNSEAEAEAEGYFLSTNLESACQKINNDSILGFHRHLSVVHIKDLRKWFHNDEIVPVDYSSQKDFRRLTRREFALETGIIVPDPSRLYRPDEIIPMHIGYFQRDNRDENSYADKISEPLDEWWHSLQ